MGGYTGKRRDSLLLPTCTSLCVSCCVLRERERESKGRNIYSFFVCCCPALQVLEMAWNSSCMEALHSSLLSASHRELKSSHSEFRLGGLVHLSPWPGSNQMDWLPGASHEAQRETEATHCSAWREHSRSHAFHTHD